MRHHSIRALVALSLLSACASMSNRPAVERSLVSACDDGDLAACADLGDALVSRDTAPGAEDHAIDRYLRACEGGHARGCRGAGLVYALGHGVPADLPTAARYFQRACDLGRGRVGCAELASAVFEGNGALRDEARGARLAQRGCDAGDASACALSGFALTHGRGVERDERRGVELLERACEARDGDGCASLAEAYERGLGVSVDVERARRALDRGCATQHPGACARLGELLERSGDGARDDARAAEAELTACAGGVGRACTDLGAAYLTGAGVGRDAREAGRRFERACALHDELGCAARDAMNGARANGAVRLTRAMLDVELRRALDAAATCQSRDALVAPGVVMIRFVVGAGGAVRASTPLGGGHPSQAVAACVATVVRRARFAAPEGDVEQLYDAQFHLGLQGVAPVVTVAPTTVEAPPPEVTPVPIGDLLSPDAIGRTVLARLSDVAACQSRDETARSSARGRVVIRFVIAHDGSVMSATVGESTYPVRAVSQCVADAVQRWRFPAPQGGGVVTVNFPFNLAPIARGAAVQ